MSIVFTCGGTGGHLYPAIAVAQTLREKGKTCLFFMAHDREDLGHVADYDFTAIPIGASKGNIWDYCMSVFRAWQALKKQHATTVICTGGKITLAVAIAAKLRGIPVLVMEQNAIPGRANRLIAKWAKHIFITFAESQSYFPNRCTLSGNPIRHQFPHDDRIKDALAYCHADHPTILVLGGSQGAARLNACILDTDNEALNRMPANWILLTGQRFATEKGFPDIHAYTIGKRKIICLTYCEAMDQLYLASDMVVARAGATTIAEILAFQKPALLIPYPHAKDNHQEANAKAVCQSPGYRWCLESDLSGHFLAETIPQLIGITPNTQGENARDVIAGYVLGDK
jgi:UDP-N-acetylglucosamine--N-acetylmuramyl-(pentapeptide) pyrophosphoryl-undecaprenol N-acetylglucosamine transferase